jgi:hypothetical protein
VIASKYTSNYVMNLLKKPLSSEQRKKAVDRVIADSFNKPAQEVSHLFRW